MHPLLSTAVLGLMTLCLSEIGWAADSVVRGAADVVPADGATWSQESRGLRGRLLMRRSQVINGTGIVTVYLELNNIGELSNPMVLTRVDQNMKFVVTDADGREAPRPSFTSRSGPSIGTPDLVLPFDSTTRFRIAPHMAGIPGNQAAYLDLGTNFEWGVAARWQGILPPRRAGDGGGAG